MIGKLEAEREFAEEYKKQFPRTGPKIISDTSVLNSTTENWCKAHGFHDRTVRRWLELIVEAIFVERKNAILKKCWELAELWQAANFSSESVEWYTPAKYIEAVRLVLGEVDLDPASSQFANATVKAKRFFTKTDDGLKRHWNGRFFVNPPYGKTSDGKSLAAEFCNKAIEEFNAGNASAGIILVNSLHSQSWQAPLYKFPVCFVDHRIQFVSGDGEENKNPTFQNIFVYLGKDLTTFAEVFGRLGYVMQVVSSRE